jgi:hypothetical protein
MIPSLLAQLYQTPHPEFKLIEVDQSGSIIVIYGNKETSQKKPPGRLILKWNLENNHSHDDQLQQQHKQQRLQQQQQQQEPIIVSPKKSRIKGVGGGGGGMRIVNK